MKFVHASFFCTFAHVSAGVSLPSPGLRHLSPMRLLPGGFLLTVMWPRDRPVPVQAWCYWTPVQHMRQPFCWGHKFRLWGWEGFSLFQSSFYDFNLTSLKREGVFISGVLSPLQSSMMAAQRPSLRGSGGHGQSSTCLQPYPAPKALSVRTRTCRNCSNWSSAHLDWIMQICHVPPSVQVQPSGTVM